MESPSVFRSVLLMALLIAPAAQACSFSVEPPGPGVFYVWDTQGDPISVSVQHRGLGGGCELSNHNAVGHDRFAWMEGSTIHVVALDDLSRSQIPWSGDHPQDLAIVEDGILVRENTGSGHDREHKVWHVFEGGKTLLYSTSQFGRLHGPYYVTESDGVGIVDVRTAEVVAPPRTASERGLAGTPAFVGTDGRFLVYQESGSGATTYHIHDLRDEDWREVTLQEYRYGEQVADGTLYSTRGGNLTIIDLASGQRSQASSPSIELLGAGGGHVVLGAYSADSVQGTWRAASAQEAALPLWPALLALLFVRRR